MEKDVLISIRGLQYLMDEESGEQEPVEVMTTGSYYKKNGHPFLMFLSLFCMSFLIVFNLYLFRIADLLRQNGMCEGIEPLHAVACEELVFLTAQLIVSRILQIQLPQQSAQCL